MTKQTEKSIFQRLVEESVVLLKNEEQTLPLKEGAKAAFFGRTQMETFFSGNGSGASEAMSDKNLLSECEKRGILAEPGLKAFYQGKQRVKPEKLAIDGIDVTKTANMTCGFMYEIFGKYQPQGEEYEVPEELLEKARRYTDTAVFVLGRNCGGEECDRHLDADYYLMESEKTLIQRIGTVYEKIILILNINGLVDLSWVTEVPAIKSILFIGIPGEDGCGAAADLLTGKANPSGKLPVTIAKKYEDYPAAQFFSWKKEDPEEIRTYKSYGLNAEENGSKGFAKSPVTFYQEDIYNGYRYFQSFGREVLYPFGYGLSYTRFELLPVGIRETERGICVSVKVTNVGSCPGKEVAQVYLSTKDTETERPLYELKGFEKTRMLSPSETETLDIWVPEKELACYVEARAAYVIEPGNYQWYVGNSSENLSLAGESQRREEVIVSQVKNCLSVKECNRDKLSFLSQRGGSRRVGMGIPKTESGLSKRQEEPEKGRDLSQWKVEELAALCVGYGPGIPFAAFGDGSDPKTICNTDGSPLTTNSHPVGVDGYVSPAMEDRGIFSVFYKDGPAGIGTGAWPTEMLIAGAFNKELWREFGDAVGAACEEKQVDVWLAPAVNIHRHPLCGRNFEYFSEDPILTGTCAVEITRGVQEHHPVMVCPKHFAVNEQDTFRRGSGKKNYDAVDSILTERAARELYLKPFEMLVKEAGISFLMTSFNKINGVFAGGNKELCTNILREEWNFTGVVVTDWGDMDVVVDGGDAIAAGNDIIMPGGPPVIRQILKALREGRVKREDLERTVRRLWKILDARAGRA